MRDTARKLLSPRPALGGALVLGLCWILVRPAGDYPLNDDWLYARATKIFAETGHVHIDNYAAPSAVGQILFSAPFVKVFGFSHSLLRALTMALALGGLWALDAIAAACEVTLFARWVLALAVVINPLYLYLSTTYMTELYGWVPAMGSAAIWFRARRVQPSNGPLVGLADAIAVGALAGAAFWCRQFAALVFPALLVSGLWPIVRLREWRRLRESAPMLLAASALFALIVRAWFAWARATGNSGAAFADPAARLFRLEPSMTLFEAGSMVVYLTAFLAPALLWLAWPPRPRWGALAGTAALVALAFLARRLCQTLGGPDNGAEHVHQHFPYVGNVLYNAGIGPVTMQESYYSGAARPHWSPLAWRSIECAIFAALVLWLPFFQGAIESRAPRSRELVLFGAALAALNFFAFSQAFQLESFDRYYLASFLGFALAIAPFVAAPKGRARAALSAAAALALLAFGVAGVHDEFRWNDARWMLVNRARAAGVDPSNLQAGYEPAGWLSYDAWMANEPLQACAGPCVCIRGGFFCRDDSYRIEMEVLPGYRAVVMETPSYWLAKGPPLFLQMRQ
jgi:hypothetical protein